MSLKPNRHYLMEQTLCNIGLPWAQRELLIIKPCLQLEPLNHLQQSQLWPTQEQKSVTRFCFIQYQLRHLNHANISQPTLDRCFPSWGCGVGQGVYTIRGLVPWRYWAVTQPNPLLYSLKWISIPSLHLNTCKINTFETCISANTEQ